MGKAKTSAARVGKASQTSRAIAAELLQARGGGEISVSELAALTVKDRRVKGRLHGKTPAATIAAQIYRCAANGELFEKAGRGTVRLLAKVA